MDWFLLAFISALLSAAAALSQKKILFNIGALEFSFFLSLFNLLFSLPFFLGVELSSVSTISVVVLYLKTILGTLAFLCVMLAIKNLDISKALPLMVLTPGFVAFFGFVLLGESLTRAEIAGMIFLLAGTYILESKESKELLTPFMVFVRSKHHHYIIFALLLFTATSILDKVLVSRYMMTPYAFMGFQHIFMAFNFFIIVLLFRKDKQKVLPSVDKSLWVWIILTAVLTVGYRYTQIEAVMIANVALVLSVKRISVFFATLIGGKLFNEKDLLRKAIATAIMVAGALLILRE